VSTLDRKLVREVWRLRGQLLAIAIVVACGVAVYVTFATNLAILQGTRASYYASQRFADVFVSVSRAPLSVARDVAALPGVEEVETRIVRRSSVEVDGFAEPVVTQLVSLPGAPDQGLNRVYLRRGGWPEPRRETEVMVLESFAEAHGLQLGARVSALMNGRYEPLRIVGIGLSPEYVFPMNPQGGLPDAKRFAVFWVPRPTLAAAYAMTGSFDELSLRLARDAEHLEPDVILAVDALLAPYGGRDAYGRSLHASDRQLSLELEQLSSQGVVVPLIFLGVAAFLLNVVLSRIIGTQREQIAALKAVGYQDARIGAHYAKLVVIVVGVGASAGTLLGAWLGERMSGLYTQFFSFPRLEYHFDTRVVFTATALTLAAAGLGTQRAVWRVISLPPAEAMRPPTPQAQAVGLLERLGIGRLLSPVGRMILRGLAARPGRAVLSVVGIAFSISILVVGNFSGDAMNWLMNVHFRLSMRDDVNVVFTRPTTTRALRELEHVEGVLVVEGLRQVPIRLVHRTRAHQLGLTGIAPRSDLRRAVAEDLRVAAIPERGLMITDYLAEMLDVRVGDAVDVQVLEGERRVVSVPVTATIHESMGVNAYATLATANTIVGEGPLVNGAALAIDPARIDDVYDVLRRRPGIAVIQRTDALFAAFEEMSGELMATMRVIFVLFASAISIGIVYNSARITFSERAHELASLRVLGFSRGEVSTILLGELFVVMALAVPVGWALGWVFVALVIEQAKSDLYRFPLILEPHSYAMSAIVVLLTGLVAALLVRRRIDHLDLVAVLKTKE
jgi:putative ABC transport system permease protein